METKICSYCGIEKQIDSFRLKKTNDKYYRYTICKECENKKRKENGYDKTYKTIHKEEILEKRKKHDKTYREKHKEQISKYKKEYRETHVLEIKLHKKEYYELNKDEILKKNHTYYNENKASISIIQKQYYELNKKYILLKSKEYAEKNKEKLSEYRKEYYNLNKEAVLLKQRQYYNDNKELISSKSKKYRQAHKAEINNYRSERKKNDPLYKLKTNVRTTIAYSFKRKGYRKNNHTYDMIGLPPQEFVNYLLQTYKNIYGTEWDGIEKVHIDHIIPLATAENEEEVINLCYYTNLQLLKEKDNLLKGDKTDWSIE